MCFKVAAATTGRGVERNDRERLDGDGHLD